MKKMKEEKNEIIYSPLELFNPISVKEEIRDDPEDIVEDVIVKEEPHEYCLASDSYLSEDEDVTNESSFLDEDYDFILNEENGENTKEVYFGIKNIFENEENDLPFPASRKNVSKQIDEKSIANSTAKRSFAEQKIRKSEMVKIGSIINYIDNLIISDNLTKEEMPQLTIYSAVEQVNNETMMCIKAGSATSECTGVLKQENEKDLIEGSDKLNHMGERKIIQDVNSRESDEVGLTTSARELTKIDTESLKKLELGLVEEEGKEPNDWDPFNAKRSNWKSEKRKLHDSEMLENTSREKRLSLVLRKVKVGINKSRKEMNKETNKKELKQNGAIGSTEQKERVKLIKHDAEMTEKLYKCSECIYLGKTKSLLRRHVMTHISVKKFQCSECCFSTMFNSYLKEHLVIHSDLRPFKCSFCNFASKLKSNIRKHEKKHRKFICRDCNDSGLCSKCRITVPEDRKVTNITAQVITAKRKEDSASEEVERKKVKIDKESIVDVKDLKVTANGGNRVDGLKCESEVSLTAIEKNRDTNMDDVSHLFVNDKLGEENKVDIFTFSEDDQPLKSKKLNTKVIKSNKNIRVKKSRVIKNPLKKSREIKNPLKKSREIKNSLNEVKMDSPLYVIKCLECHFETSSARQMTKHKFQHLRPRRYNCLLCTFKFSTKRLLQLHENSEHRKDSELLENSECLDTSELLENFESLKNI